MEREETWAGQLEAEESRQLRWTSADLARLRKGGPEKIRVARRLPPETTMTLTWIARRPYMGTVGSLANLFRNGNK